MLRRTLVSLAVLTSAFLGTALAPSGASAFDRPSRYVVTFHSGVDAQAMGSAWSGQGLKVVRVFGSLLSGLAVDLTADQAAALAADPNVARIEADVTVRPAASQTGVSWALDRIDQADTNWVGSFSYPNSAGSGVQVFVIDSGLTSEFEFLAGHTIPNEEFAGRVGKGFSFVQQNDDTDDCLGHGTHITGSIASTSFGVAKRASVTPVKVLDCDGWGNMSDVVAALDWIAASRDRSKPAVVNISVSGPASDSLDDAVNRMSDSGVTVVVAAGNDESDACMFSPARAASAVTVGATSSIDARAVFSNYGSCVDVFAPGIDIESTGNNRDKPVRSSAGTSSSAALVSGTAALILADNPGLSPAQVRDRIVSTATAGVLQKIREGSPNLLLRVPNAS